MTREKLIERACERCGTPIEHSGYCSMECGNAVINNPARIALIEKAKEFRLDRIGYFSREEEMADFALSVSGWTAIKSADDLPKVEGKYLVTQIYRVSPHEVEMSRYKPDDPFYQQNWLNNYSAWCECPAPYEPQESK
jgi:hypothetical protein